MRRQPEEAMAYKTILVHSDAGKTTPGRIALAAALAERFGAHLIGLHIRQRFEAPMFTDATAAISALYQSYEDAMKAEEAGSQAAFRAALTGKQLSSEWRADDDFAEDALTAAGRYADLIVVGQREPEPTPEATPPDLPEKLALYSERPILVVPHIGAAQPLGRTIMVCWNGQREASRAVTAALPFLKKADRVTLLTLGADETDDAKSAERAVEWLDRHGVKAVVQRDSPGDTDVGNVILSRAADASADLIVMGIYGHSRMREFVLGGASRTLLACMTVPILIAH
jgi:nucleotide-binding universal stress UspA family protein